MPKILFFDTETTGFPNAGPLNSQPNIVQLAGALYEHKEWSPSDQIDEYEFDELFNSIEPISQRLTDIHGISNEMVQDKPLLCKSSFILKFMNMMSEADLICAHNADFDLDMIEIEIKRAITHMPEKRDALPQFMSKCRQKTKCTMKSSVDYCQLPGRYGEYKWPKLMELHTKLFGVGFEDAHNALNDIRATKKCFFELYRLGILK